jgi:hypothetical protein
MSNIQAGTADKHDIELHVHSSPCTTDHSAVKPLRVAELSDVNVTLRKPVDELYTLDGLRVPASLRMRSDESSHVAVSQRSIDT